MTTYLAKDEGEAKEGKCIFCGKVEMMTGEHIFASWTSKAGDLRNHPNVILTSKYGGKITKETVDLTKFTNPRNFGHVNMRLYVLCKDCNNGWGSILQDKASQILKPVLDGSAWHLTEQARETVASWITSLTMVRQYLHPELKAIGEAECREFFSTHAPMAGVSVWVAKYSGVNSHECRYRSYLSSTNADSPDTCSLTAVFRGLIFFVFWSSNASIVRSFSTADPGPFYLLNSLAERHGTRKWIPNPENMRGPVGHSGPGRYPLHDMLAELGMTQVWPTFEKYSDASLATLTQQDFIQLNDLATYAVTEMDNSLANARELAREAIERDQP